MASQKQAILLCLCAALAFSSLASAAKVSNIISEAPNQLISRVCDHTDHPPLCLATVLPYAGSGRVDLESIFKYSVEASSEYAKEALAAVKNLANSKDSTPEVRGTLKDCKNSYSTAVENFSKTKKAMDTNDIGTMRSVLSAVITFIADCEDEFTEMQTPSPMSAYSQKLTDMTSNCLAIIAQMHT